MTYRMTHRSWFLVVAVVFLLGANAYARGHAKANAPRRLDDQQLDRITAGTSGQDLGGTIVAAGSQANIGNSAAVTMTDATQQGAKALNLVNTSDSRMANGVNVWDGQPAGQNGATKLNVAQDNEVSQHGNSGYASLSDYQRTGANVATSYSSTKHSTSSSSNMFTNNSSVDTKQSIASGSPSSPGGEGTSMGSPSPGVDIQAGQGISGTGKLNIAVDAGSVSINTSGSASLSHQTEATVGKAGVTLTSKASADYNANLNWNLPKLNLSFNGGICYVELGSCSAVGSSKTTSSSASSQQNTYMKTVQSPVHMRNAKAQNIVADGSKLTATNDYSVLLSGNAQANAQALNLVNAAGSLISNGVNVARTPTVGPILNLNQTNSIVQDH